MYQPGQADAFAPRPFLFLALKLRVMMFCFTPHIHPQIMIPEIALLVKLSVARLTFLELWLGLAA